MPVFSQSELAVGWGISTRTVSRRIKELKKKKKFKKVYPGREYTELEISQLTTLLGLKWQPPSVK
jgi:DNA-binding Lrp family transcriptional regulator